MRQVFVLIDGTKCTLYTKTNIGKLHRLSTRAQYVRCYSPGIGANSRTRTLDSWLAPNLEPKALDIYQTLLTLDLNYDDHIYIFGYSRGAVVARVLAMCISSSESLKAAARRSGVYGSIHAQIDLVCLFDPVVGWPRLFRSFVRNHDAVIEPRVRNYVELLACGEQRLIYPSDSYSASRYTRGKVGFTTSVSGADSTRDRRTFLHHLQLLKTRRCIWFPGKHSDIGGNGVDSSLGAHALATALEELLASAERAGVTLAFPITDLKEMVLDKMAADELSVGQSKVSFPRFSIKVIRLFRRWFTQPLLRRAPEKRSLIQHLAHPTCKQSEHTSSLAQMLPEYPKYRHIEQYYPSDTKD